MKLRSRRVRNVLLLLIAAVLAIVLAKVTTTALRDTSRISGWTILGMVVFLALYNVRKRLPFLPLGSSAFWLQSHVYIGLLTAVIFGIHVSWRIPSGVFESVLALLYMSVFLSGVVGLVLTRSFPTRLATRGEDVLFERISIYRKRLEDEVEQIVLRCLRESDSSSIPQFHAEHLKPFFQRMHNFWPHVLQSVHPRAMLLGAINSQERYLNETERVAMREIASCVKAKDDLDHQFALQATLKYWLFLHVPLTYALLVFAVVHLLLVHAFSGAAG